MVYLEERKIGGKTYYYIVRNVRAGKNKWRKETEYFGTKKPSNKDIVEFSKRTEKVSIKYLSKEQLNLLNKLKTRYKDYLSKLTEHDFVQFEDATITSFTYNTNAIEGSTLTLQDTGIILNEKITPPGKELREIYGAINIKNAYNYMKKMKNITESTIKKIHSIVMKNILEQELGECRTVPVRIIGSYVQPPLPIDVENQMKELLEWYNKNKNMHPFELACLLHVKFEKIHPFIDGNGRVGRLIMNFVLLKNKYPLLDVKVDKKLDYYKTLENAQIRRKYRDFIDFSLSIYEKDAKSMGWI
ncbi:Fic family protein [archaeon]|nr:Fic family protein [archaeon]